MTADSMEFEKGVGYANITGHSKMTSRTPTYYYKSVAKVIDITGPLKRARPSITCWAPQFTSPDRRKSSDRKLHNVGCLRYHPNHTWQFGVPETITTDNGLPPQECTLYKLYAKYQIKGNHSSRYHARANEMVEVFNYTLRIILEKMMSKSKDFARQASWVLCL